MDLPNNLRGPNPLGHARISMIDQPHQPQPLSTRLGHNRALGTAINKSLDRNSVNFRINIEHDYPGKRLRVVLHRRLKILVNIFHSDGLLDLFLRFNIQGIGVQPGDSLSLLQLILSASLLHVGQLLSHLIWVTFLDRVSHRFVLVLDTLDEVRVLLGHLKQLVCLFHVPLERVSEGLHQIAEEPRVPSSLATRSCCWPRCL
mmetsp:Transcript_30558/g.47870  ORF Transcript_30558/g.47870 Transcript_30558/m.47870 type:complete len:202 (+) Transcript_30558:1498-2103(+)